MWWLCDLSTNLSSLDIAHMSKKSKTSPWPDSGRDLCQRRCPPATSAPTPRLRAGESPGFHEQIQYPYNTEPLKFLVYGYTVWVPFRIFFTEAIKFLIYIYPKISRVFMVNGSFSQDFPGRIPALSQGSFASAMQPSGHTALSASCGRSKVWALRRCPTWSSGNLLGKLAFINYIYIYIHIIYLCVYLFIIYLSICLFIYLSIYLSIYLFIYILSYYIILYHIISYYIILYEYDILYIVSYYMNTTYYMYILYL